ncbi:hypothetical protein ACKKBG_A21940 [Auxenochlorella protothecoides x Auxenochlorella symbiontica]
MVNSAICTKPLPAPPSVDAKLFKSFGVEVVSGFDPTDFTPEQFIELERLLYEHDVVLFRGLDLAPEHQYKLTKAFDPTCESYGHGNNQTTKQAKSVLHPDLKTIPSVPQVQLIGNGIVHDHWGLAEAKLKHPHHRTFHKDPVSEEDEAAGATRFYRWHIDAALYGDLAPPKVTSLYAVAAPAGPPQVCRYDDGTGDELAVPLGTTAFVSGTTMLDALPPALRSLAVRSSVRYAPHPYVWMARAHALPTGLGLEDEGLEVPPEELPPWDPRDQQTLPVCWRNPVTGRLHLQVHPCAIQALVVEPLPPGAASRTTDALYPDGGEVTDLAEVRRLVYALQRPGIAPGLVYPHAWSDGDLVLFHNRGVLHSVVGAFRPDQVRKFHQCNLAASDLPAGPTPEDIATYA